MSQTRGIIPYWNKITVSAYQSDLMCLLIMGVEVGIAHIQYFVY